MQFKQRLGLLYIQATFIVINHLNVDKLQTHASTHETYMYIDYMSRVTTKPT
jgi:hypothetical protein